MPFTLRLDGEPIAEIDEQVLGVSLQTGRGETARMGVGPQDGVVDIILDKVASGGPVRLDQIEAAARKEVQDRATEGELVGSAPGFFTAPAKGLHVGQGVHDETLRKGGVDTQLGNETRTNVNPPSRDLASGLNPTDTDVLTARLTAFGKHGDADKAIEDNPASGKPFTAEQGATTASSSDDRSARATGDDNQTSASGSGSGPSKPGGGGIKLKDK